MIKNTILIFDTDSTGHHGSYIFHLVQQHLSTQNETQLVVVLNPDFLAKHPEIVGSTGNSEKVVWVFIEQKQIEVWQKQPNVVKRSIIEWKIFCDYATIYKANHGFFMYLDHLQLAILTQKKAPCSFSGIFFRASLQNYKPENWKEKITYFRKKLLLYFLLQNKQLTALLFLDPYAVEYINKKWGIDKALYLPDPVKIYEDSGIDATTLKKELKIEEDRKILLLFGYLDSRKNIPFIIDAIAKLPKEIAKKGCLLIVGAWDLTEFEIFKEKQIALGTSPDFQIVLINQFVSEETIQTYFEISDYILALYQKHIGMSGVMVRAAAIQKPLIAFNFGLMGKIVNDNDLGITIENSSDDDLSQKIALLLSRETPIGNEIKMQAFADRNTPSNYANVLLNWFYDQRKVC
jgi:glycosyltransferase involved in cell wall biosynthesis